MAAVGRQIALRMRPVWPASRVRISKVRAERTPEITLPGPEKEGGYLRSPCELISSLVRRTEMGLASSWLPHRKSQEIRAWALGQ